MIDGFVFCEEGDVKVDGAMYDWWVCLYCDKSSALVRMTWCATDMWLFIT